MNTLACGKTVLACLLMLGVSIPTNAQQFTPQAGVPYLCGVCTDFKPKLTAQGLQLWCPSKPSSPIMTYTRCLPGATRMTTDTKGTYKLYCGQDVIYFQTVQATTLSPYLSGSGPTFCNVCDGFKFKQSTQGLVATCPNPTASFTIGGCVGPSAKTNGQNEYKLSCASWKPQ